MAHIFGLLEGKQSWGGRFVIFPFLVSPMIGLGWTSRVRSRPVTGTGWCHQRAQGLFGGILRSFYAVGWNSLVIFHHPSSLAFIPMHSNNFWIFELFVGLTQLITLKVEFREEYMMEHLSVIAHWNQDKDTYMVGKLDTGFSDRRKRGNRFTLFCIKKNILTGKEEGKVLHD